MIEGDVRAVYVDLALWGKRRGLPEAYPVVCHLLDAGAAIGVVWDLYLSPAGRRRIAAGLGVGDDQARQLLMFWAALHDIGKIAYSFQAKVQDAFGALEGYEEVPGGHLDHDQVVHQWLGVALGELGYRASSLRGAAFQVAQLLGGHHGRFFPLRQTVSKPLAYFPSLGREKWEEQRKACLSAVHRVFGAPGPPPKVMDADVAGVVCGLVVLADWLVSQDFFVIDRLAARPEHGDVASLKAHFHTSMRQVPGLLEKAGLSRLRLQSGGFQDEFGFGSNYLQRSLAEELPNLVGQSSGLLLITAPTGDGKTEIALHSARIMGRAAGVPGIFVGVPTMATADQMYRRVVEYGERRAIDPAPITLLHSMAWLNPTYSRDAPPGGEADPEILTGEENESAWIAATEWLQARNRGLLAPLSVGTIDQALLAVLCGRHNMLRMMGLSGKTLIVDEVHAYDAYMQGLLARLLTWLGKLGVPVVLLSATLPRQVGRRLVGAYLRGAGHRSMAEATAGYPGWLHVNAESGQVTSRTLTAESRTLDIDVCTVPIGENRRPDRRTVLQRLAQPLVETGSGCVGIICNTVGEAQQTFDDLSTWLKERAEAGLPVPDLQILHSRFPADDRADITANVIERFGKDGLKNRRRPTSSAAILVATQVVEQSVDLDFDLLISDLAPIALLLQRAGRCHRHAHNDNLRPSWAARARLAVLSPVGRDGEPVVPDGWPFIYPAALLRRTREALNELPSPTIEIPRDVQPLVELVYDEDFLEPTRPMDEDDIARIADEQVKTFLAQQVAIPEPAKVTNLHELTSSELDEQVIRTRLGADSARVICCYRRADGRLFLDPGMETELPEGGSLPGKRFTKDEVRVLLGRTIPVPAAWVQSPGQEALPPPPWLKNVHLRDVLLLVHSVDDHGRIRPAQLAVNRFQLSENKGLERLE